jgi:hypothetical protein
LVPDVSTAKKSTEMPTRMRRVVMGSPSDVEGAPARVKKSGRRAKESRKKAQREPEKARGREATTGDLKKG